MRTVRRYVIIILSVCLGASVVGRLNAQDTLTLNECYRLLEKNYPLVKQKQFISESNTLSKQAIQKNYLPQLSLDAQATYQSEITKVPVNIPGMEVPSPNKDQYKATLTMNQLLYDGGRIRSSVDVQELASQVEQQQVDISLYQLKDRVNQWYFSILLLQEKQALLALVKKNLDSRYNEVRSAVRNGAALASADDIIYAEILKTDQQLFELAADRKASVRMLAEFINTPIAESTVFQQPAIEPVERTERALARPEITLYNLQRMQLDASSSLTGKDNAPRLSLFVQGGYGNPGLNMLDNSFQTFYMGGVRLNWNLWDWHAARNRQQVLAIGKKVTDNRQEVFELNTSLELTQLHTEIDKIEQLIRTDEAIIALRRNIEQTARAQLRHGAVTSSEYITELTKLHEAEVTRKTHEIQLLMTRARYGLTRGTPQG